VSRFQFVADHRDAFEVKWLCAVVEIARSSFYAWLAAADGRAARQAADDALQERIRTVHTTDATYGAPRVTAELNDGVPEVERVNHKRVARVMRVAGIAGYRRRRRVKTTVPDPANQKVPDLLNRDFNAATTNLKYVGDIKCRRRHLMSYADLRNMPMRSSMMFFGRVFRAVRSA
jgi:transposase InsO family protein